MSRKHGTNALLAAAAWLAALAAPGSPAARGAAPPADAPAEAAPPAATLRLRGEAHVTGTTIRVDDVLVLPEPLPAWLAPLTAQPIDVRADAPQRVELTHDQVVAALDRLGADPARVLVNGALRCTVVLSPDTRPAADAPSGAAADEWAPPPAGAGPDGASSLSALLIEQVRGELAEWGGQVEIEFDRASQEFLDLSAPPFAFSLRAHSGPKLGLRQFTVAIRRDGRQVRSIVIGARVKLVLKVLVAARPLNQGSLLKRDDVEYAARIFTDERDIGVTDLERVVGQQVRRFVPQGERVLVKDLKSIDLVTRSRPVTVTGGESIRIQWVGTALDNGELGETVRVRLGDMRSRRIVRATVSGVATVQLLEDGR